jgi:hypothetical protein
VPSTKRSGPPARKRKKYAPSEKQRASDEKLREILGNFDLKTFDQALDRALKSKG